MHVLFKLVPLFLSKKNCFSTSSLYYWIPNLIAVEILDIYVNLCFYFVFNATLGQKPGTSLVFNYLNIVVVISLKYDQFRFTCK